MEFDLKTTTIVEYIGLGIVIYTIYNVKVYHVYWPVC